MNELKKDNKKWMEQVEKNFEKIKVSRNVSAKSNETR